MPHPHEERRSGDYVTIGVFKWIAGALVGVLIAVMGFGFRSMSSSHSSLERGLVEIKSSIRELQNNQADTREALGEMRGRFTSAIESLQAEDARMNMRILTNTEASRKALYGKETN